MKRLTIDFAPPSLLGALMRVGPGTRLLALAGLALWLYAGVEARQRLDRFDAVEQDLGKVELALAARTAQRKGPAEAAVPEAQAEAVNAAVKQLNLPWRDVLDAIEAGTPPSVGVLALEPDAKRNIVRVEAESANGGEMLGYVEQLKRQPFLSSVFVTKHAIDQNDNHHPLRFQVEAAWRSEAP